MIDVNEIGVSTNTYHKFELDKALKGIKEAGFNYVELTSVMGYTEHVVPENMEERDIAELKDLLDNYGLSVSAISGHSDLTIKDGCDHLKAVIDLAGELDAKVVNTGISMQEDPEAGLSEEAERSFYENIEDLGDFASKNGVNIGIETHDFLKTAQQGSEILTNIESGSVGLNYDTGNVIFYGGVRPEEDIKNLKSEGFTCMHLKDKLGGKGEWNFPALGEGEINFGPVFDWLDSIDYRGPVNVEIEFDGSEEETLQEVNEAVTDSYEFLEGLLQ
ncbi:MAG: sugar phosphate isomerase/epimerase family protein [Candidatus Bipolaricaulota bacterium]|nr:sugar phosphate isomerase/epimerase [Candidatus Bipolaricaulota bacterium]MBS3791576.1 sugar phosphate isomerase/epimerase [Candidatus Bipolaricaulota bacterium]